MNKNLFKICFVAAVLISASSAYAANLTGATVIGGGTYCPSNKVNVNAVATSTNYAAESKHSSGDRIMGTNNTDPKLYWTTSTVGSTAGAPADGATTAYSTWTSL